MERNLRSFYDEYWQYRESVGKIHTKKGYYIPRRLKVAVSMMSGDGKGKKILDVGCGEGALGMLVKEKLANCSITGCDISEKTIELARPYYDNIFQADIENDNLAAEDKFAGDKFDYIVCVEVLEHIMYPDRALRILRDYLSKSGNMIVSFPNIAWWKYRLKLLRGHFPEESRLYHHAEHLHDFTMHTFTRLLKKVGLEPVALDGEFVPPGFLQRFKTKRWVESMMRRYPNLFGYQIVIKAKAV